MDSMIPESVKNDEESYWNLRVKPFWKVTNPAVGSLARMKRKVSVFNEFDTLEPPNEETRDRIVRENILAAWVDFGNVVTVYSGDKKARADLYPVVQDTMVSPNRVNILTKTLT